MMMMMMMSRYKINAFLGKQNKDIKETYFYPAFIWSFHVLALAFSLDKGATTSLSGKM